MEFLTNTHRSIRSIPQATRLPFHSCDHSFGFVVVSSVLQIVFCDNLYWCTIQDSIVLFSFLIPSGGSAPACTLKDGTPVPGYRLCCMRCSFVCHLVEDVVTDDQSVTAIVTSEVGHVSYIGDTGHTSCSVTCHNIFISCLNMLLRGGCPSRKHHYQSLYSSI